MATNLGFGASNPYLDKTIEDAIGDTTRAYNLTTAPAYTSSMVRSGSFGNSGVQELQNEAQRQLQTSLGRQANDMRSQNYQFDKNFGQNAYQFDQNFDRAVYNDAFGQNQQNIQTGLALMDYQNRSNQQNLGFGTQIQNTPLGYYQGFAGTANGIGQGFGTSSGSMSGGGSSPFVSALGGAQLGSALWKGWGSGQTNGNGGYTSGGQTYNNPSAYGGSQPYMQDMNSYYPTYR